MSLSAYLHAHGHVHGGRARDAHDGHPRLLSAAAHGVSAVWWRNCSLHVRRGRWRVMPLY